ncbi:Protein of unknown function [Desulfatibacillum alkenivorans DSM 16219]|jgi:hypothetical protein|uniref:DUF4079 domain-containing protein n=1 Tax=Desulfatibacillum alkenivorans DSM 16219 TaxID=1121393 RepID=A0A1M6PIH1_9BACT|nr:DUF4079 family protein [Desulfatibacillum alkenivorans]SHK07717.1 Protein of unknown function [Desulfatibacillum alkenivorans DSM 16219]
MIYMHPFFQALMFVLALYALFLAVPRFLALHTGRVKAFSRKRHALAGGAAFAGALSGMLGGGVMTRLLDLEPYVGGNHENLAGIMAALMILGMASGLYLYFKPRKRKALPAAHGLINLFILFLFLFQAYTGLGILNRISQGG